MADLEEGGVLEILQDKQNKEKRRGTQIKQKPYVHIGGKGNSQKKNNT